MDGVSLNHGIDDILDGQRIFEDISYSDSYGREFYALEDGSYFIIENQTTTLFGAAYLIKILIC